MTLDHVAILLKGLYPTNYDITILYNVFRALGRLSLPLFIFMIVEGVVHTKSISKYLLRLGIIAAIISIAIAVITYIPSSYNFEQLKGAGNIFLDLLLTALTIYILKTQNGCKKLFILLPLAISIISFSIKCYEKSTTNSAYWYPTFLYLQGDWFSLVLGIGFYYSKYIAKSYINNYAKQNNLDPYVFEYNGTSLVASNIICIFVLFVTSIILYCFKYLWPSGVYWDAEIQLSAVFSGALILFYNGKRGYNAKWFQYGSYLYYPVHILILLLIYILIG